MNQTKKRILVASVAFLLCVSVLSLLIVLAPSTHLHYEMRTASGTVGKQPVFIRVAGLADCILTVGYENDNGLMYRLDIELYEAGEPISIRTSGDDGTYQYTLKVNPDNFGPTRARYVDLTLGTGHAYKLALGCDVTSENVTGTVVFGNNATLGNEIIDIGFPGSLSFIFTDSVDISQGGLDLNIGQYGYNIQDVSLYVDLPEEMYGNAQIVSNSMSVATTGWTLYREETYPPYIRYYKTSNRPVDYILDILIYADAVSAILLSRESSIIGSMY